ncbi:MAG: prephenate dehydrogenase [Alphaproteobacteria bacterium]
MNIGIIGIGCIGSSLARDIKAKSLGQVYLCDNNPDYLQKSQELGLGDQYFDKAEDLAKDCDIIFVCVPVTAIPLVIKSIAPYLKSGAIVTDVGSVKSFILEQVSGCMPDNAHYIPGHPITSGTVETGPEAGREGVFEGARYILTPPSDTSSEPIKTISNLLEGLGADILLLDPDKHDQLLGFTSHLSHVIAFSAMNSASKLSEKLGEDVTRYAGGSFKDLTRVAASDVTMWRDIFLCNKKHVRELYKGTSRNSVKYRCLEQRCCRIM